MSQTLYDSSQLFRYAEESLAESTAQLGTRNLSGLSFGDALRTGLEFPFSGGYEPMSILGIAREAGIGAAGFGAAAGGLYLWTALVKHLIRLESIINIGERSLICSHG